jgi:uncharacterized protein YggE
MNHLVRQLQWLNKTSTLAKPWMFKYKTQGISFQPAYSWVNLNGVSQNKLVDFIGRISLLVTTAIIDASVILDIGLKEATTLSLSSYATRKNMELAKLKAIDKAYKSAIQKSEVVLQAMEGTNEKMQYRILKVEIDPSIRHVYGGEFRALGVSAPSGISQTEIYPGEVSVNAAVHLQVEFGIKP